MFHNPIGMDLMIFAWFHYIKVSRPEFSSYIDGHGGRAIATKIVNQIRALRTDISPNFI